MAMTKDEIKYELAPLPYSFDALEPYIDAQTMEIHYTKHHQAYLSNLMKADGFKVDIPLTELLVKDSRPVVQNNGGGHYNHTLFWQMLKKGGGGMPKGDLLKAIEKKFKTFDEFKTAFTNAGLTQFGSGWAWLVQDHAQGDIEIIQRPNQNHPDIGRVCPLLGIDVWEHAYYLKYQNRRADYVQNFWNVVNWDFVASRYQKR